jgi:cyclase
VNRLRLIARLDIKSERLIKGINLEGLRVIGDPNQFAIDYYKSGIDEILCVDVVASLYRRITLTHIIEAAVKDVFVPITAGGGVRSVGDAQILLRAGADKIAINTAAIANPALISELAQTFGSQAIVLSIAAKRRAAGSWEAFTDNGREPSGFDVVEWARRGASLGAGEILLTSIDQEGTRKGFDVELVKAVSDVLSIPVVASGGLGEPQHLVAVARATRCSGVAVADALHYRRYGVGDLRAAALEAGLPVRLV